MRKGVFVPTETSNIDEYVCRMLADMQKHVDSITVVVNSRLEESWVEGGELPEALSGYDIVYDTGNYVNLYVAGTRHILGLEPEDEVNESAVPDIEIVCFTDTFYPFAGFDEIFRRGAEEMAKKDAWGISSSYDPTSKRLRSMNPNSYLIHPFFIVMKRPAVLAFLNYRNTRLGIDHALMTALAREKCSMGVLYRTDKYGYDSTLHEPAELLEQGFPIVRKALFNNATSTDITEGLSHDALDVLHFVAEHTDGYDKVMFESIVKTVSPSNINFKIGAHYVLSDDTARKANALFVYYAQQCDVLDNAIEYLEKLSQSADLLLVAKDDESLALLGDAIAGRESLEKARLMVSAGDGTVASRMLEAARPYVDAYEFIGFAHDMSLDEMPKYQKDAIEAMIYSSTMGFAGECIRLLEETPRLGLMVPPVPLCGNYYNVSRQWMDEFATFQGLCEKLGIACYEDVDQADCMTAGMAFWCRKAALQQLLEYDWKPEDLVENPLKRYLPLDAVVEHSLAFVAKANGFFTGVAYSQDCAANMLNDLTFIKKNQLALYNADISHNGTTYSAYRHVTRKLVKPRQDNTVELQRELDKRKKEVKLIKHSKYFDKKYYLTEHPEVADLQISPAEHYLIVGWKRGFNPSEQFDNDDYLMANPGVKKVGICPLLHFERNGKYEGRKLGIDRNDYRPYSKQRERARIRGIKKHQDLIEKNKDARILVILHLYYMSAWQEIKEYLKNLDAYSYDLVVTHTDAIVNEKVLNDIHEYKPDAVIKQFPNKGFDVGTYTEVIAQTDLTKYDIIFKLQSKGVNRPRIFIYGEYMEKRDWFLNLYEGCIGPDNVHITIDKLLNDPQIGLVAAKNLIVEDPSHKQNMVKEFMEEQGLELPDKYLYVAGTCFACKAASMQAIADMNLTVDQYLPVGRGFSLAHKMERVICLVIISAGYEFYGNECMVALRTLRKLNPHYREMNKYTGVRLLDDDRFTLDDEFVFFSLEHRLVKKYELVDIRLGDIKRRWRTRDIPLSECMPYRYLVTGDPKIYEEYMRQNQQYYKLDIMSRERFDALIESIETNGFTDENVVVVNEDNVIMDGQHRCCYMMYKYGEDYRIPCLRLYSTDYFKPKKRMMRVLDNRLSEDQYLSLQSKYRTARDGLLRAMHIKR